MNDQLSFDFGVEYIPQKTNKFEISVFNPKTEYLEVGSGLDVTVKGKYSSERYLNKWLNLDQTYLSSLPKDRDTARTQKSKKFFTSKPCGNGHVSTRKTSTGHCDACDYLANHRQTKWREKQKLRSRELIKSRRERFDSNKINDNWCATNPPLLSRADAIQSLQKFFYTGRVCKNEHFSQRYTLSGKCVVCQKLESVRDRAVTVVKQEGQVTVSKIHREEFRRNEND